MKTLLLLVLLAAPLADAGVRAAEGKRQRTCAEADGLLMTAFLDLNYANAMKGTPQHRELVTVSVVNISKLVGVLHDMRCTAANAPMYTKLNREAAKDARDKARQEAENG